MTAKSKIQVFKTPNGNAIEEIYGEDGDWTFSINTLARTFCLRKRGNYYINSVSVKAYKNAYVMEPSVKKLVDTVMREYRNTFKDGLLFKSHFGKTTIADTELRFSIGNSGMQKAIAEAETPLELTKYAVPCEYSKDDFYILFGGSGATNIGKTTNVNDIIDPKSWARIRDIARRAPTVV